jgi:hypothetical protein
VNPDILAAVVAFLRATMGVTAWADAAAPGAAYPYAVVLDGPESYAVQSEDPETGRWLDCLATGVFSVRFYCATKFEARQLGRRVVRALSDSQSRLLAADGAVRHVAPIQGVPDAVSTTGAGVPDVFLWITTFQYVQEFGV